jgi:hypothetical protein
MPEKQLLRRESKDVKDWFKTSKNEKIHPITDQTVKRQGYMEERVYI